MAKRLLIFIVVLFVVVGIGGYAYNHYRTDRRFNGGEVVDETGAVATADGSAPVATPSRSETGRSESAPSDNAQTRPVPDAPQPVEASSTAPATDSIAPNPPNRASFAGTGRFQVYRQGDLTWRINTDTGSTCILFATNEQWRKPVVYRNGCGNS